MDERSIKRLAVIILTAVILILVFKSVGLRMATQVGQAHQKTLAAHPPSAPPAPAAPNVAPISAPDAAPASAPDAALEALPASAPATPPGPDTGALDPSAAEGATPHAATGGT